MYFPYADSEYRDTSHPTLPLSHIPTLLHPPSPIPTLNCYKDLFSVCLIL